MTASERIRGNSGLYLTLTPVDGGTTYRADIDVKKADLSPADASDDDLTFEEAASGDSKEFTLDLTAIQSTAAASLHSFLWDNPGASFDAVLGIHGNAIPTEDKPHYTFVCKADGRPKIGKEASRDKKGSDFDYSMEVEGQPVRVETAV